MKNQSIIPGATVMNNKLLQDWLREKLALEASLDIDAVDLDTDFSSYNLDSLSAVSLAFDLETLTGIVIDPTAFSEFKTPNELVKWLELQLK